MRGKNQKNGFTLIELLVVISIIGIISTLAIISVNTARIKARDVKRIADLRQIQTALELYFDDNHAYPDVNKARSREPSWDTLATELEPYMPILPKDLINADNFTYFYDGGSGVGDEEYGLMAKLEYTANFDLSDNDSGDYARGNGEYYEVGPDPTKVGNWWND